jgi:hypothetical protein
MKTDRAEPFTSDPGWRVTMKGSKGGSCNFPCTVCGRPIGSETMVWNGQGLGFRHEVCRRTVLPDVMRTWYPVRDYVRELARNGQSIGGTLIPQPLTGVTGTEWTWRCLSCEGEVIEHGGGVADPTLRRVACLCCGRITRQERVL